MWSSSRELFWAWLLSLGLTAALLLCVGSQCIFTAKARPSVRTGHAVLTCRLPGVREFLDTCRLHVACPMSAHVRAEWLGHRAGVRPPFKDLPDSCP